MYVVKRCDDYSYGQNKWVEVKVTPDKQDAISFMRGELRLLYASDINMASKDIDSRMQGWGAPTENMYLNGRRVYSHGNTAYSLVKSHAAKYDDWRNPERPTRTEVLDKILGS